MTPQRIQLRRTKGWRMPANTISVARPSMWGNPYRVGGTIKATGRFVPDAAAAVALYRERAVPLPCDLALLRGKNLACWCPLDQACHADVLLELANQ